MAAYGNDLSTEAQRGFGDTSTRRQRELPLVLCRGNWTERAEMIGDAVSTIEEAAAAAGSKIK
jgi:hypothetical protein